MLKNLAFRHVLRVSLRGYFVGVMGPCIGPYESFKSINSIYYVYF